MIFNAFGENYSSGGQSPRVPILVDEANAGVVYLAFAKSLDDLGHAAIWRVQTLNGVTNIFWAKGAWDAR